MYQRVLWVNTSHSMFSLRFEVARRLQQAAWVPTGRRPGAADMEPGPV